jgi:hypothetical protein
MVAQTDGALIAGSEQSNPIHSQLTRERDRGSPFWQPIFDGGRSVRFLNRDPFQAALNADRRRRGLLTFNIRAIQLSFGVPRRFGGHRNGWLRPAASTCLTPCIGFPSSRRAGGRRSVQSARCAAGFRTQLLDGVRQGLGERRAPGRLDRRRHRTVGAIHRRDPCGDDSEQ